MIKKLSITAIKFYQNNLRFLFPAGCRYHPTCSDYALEAVHKFTALKALRIIAYRILRCNPFFSGGHDPVR